MSNELKKFMEEFINTFDTSHSLSGDKHSLSNRLSIYSVEDKFLKEDIEISNYLLSRAYKLFKKELYK